MPAIFFQDTNRAVNSKFSVVNLINATRLPARHSKFVWARLDNPKETSFTLFEPAKEALGLLMEEGVAQPDTSGFFTLIVENYSFSPVCLKKGGKSLVNYNQQLS